MGEGSVPWTVGRDRERGWPEHRRVVLAERPSPGPPQGGLWTRRHWGLPLFLSHTQVLAYSTHHSYELNMAPMQWPAHSFIPSFVCSFSPVTTDRHTL